MNNEKRIIIADKDIDYMPNMNLYEFINIQYKIGHAFVVCHVTNDEFELMQKIIQNRNILPERLSSENSYGYNINRYLLKFNSNDNIIEITDYNDENKTKGNYYIDNGELKYDNTRYHINTENDKKNESLVGYRIYTTETYDDIIFHYNKEFNPTKEFIEETVRNYNELLKSGLITNQDKSVKVLKKTKK